MSIQSRRPSGRSIDPRLPSLLLLIGSTAAAAQSDADARLPTIPVAPPPAEIEPVDAASRPIVIDEVVVTANRRAESVQKIVGSVQVFSGENLEKAGADAFEDYLTQVPGTGYRKDGSGQTKIGMRGVSNVSGNQIGTFSGASPVGIYLNEVPIQGSGQLPDLDLYDLDRIEVLKGPQGTLYGEGAMGGAVRMLLNEPSFGAAEMKTEAGLSYTEHGGWNQSLKAAGGFSLSDTLAFRAVATGKWESGYIDLINQHRKDANDSDQQSLRLQGRWAASEVMDVDLLYLKDRSHLDGSPNVRPELRKRYENDIYEREYAKSDLDIVGLTLKYRFDAAELTAVSAYSDGVRDGVFRLGLIKDLLTSNLETALGEVIAQQLINLAFDITQIRTESYDNHIKDSGFSQEIRLVSVGDSRLRWIAGFYYQDRKQAYDQLLTIHNSPTPGEPRELARLGDQPVESYAVFGQLNYQLTPSLEATVGARFFHETIGINDRFTSYGLAAIIQATGLEPNPAFLDVESTYEDVLPRFALNWALSDSKRLYAQAARGYRTTTPNVQINLDVGRPFLDPDFLWNYEVGAKTQWGDGRLNVNVSVYQIDWNDLQADRVGTAHIGVLPIDVIYIDNIGDARIRGTELEVAGMITQAWSIVFGLAYQDGKLVTLSEGSTAIPDSRIPNSPKWSGSLVSSYGIPLSAAYLLSFTASLQYVGDQASTEVTPKDPTGSETAAYTQLGLTISLDAERWGLSLFGSNLLDEIIEVQNASLTESENFTTLGRPRTVGLRAQYRF